MHADQVCVTPRAKFGFHLPYPVEAATGKQIRTKEAEAARKKMGDWMMTHYPEPVVAWLKKTGGLTAKFKFLSGNELVKMGIPACGDEFFKKFKA